jgi:hypothetical protein
MDSLMRRLITASTAAADAGEFEVAFHALMAALHAAERVGKDAASAESLTEIMRVGAAHAAKIEKVKPQHQLSRNAAKARGHTSLYDTLQLHANAARMRVQADMRRDKPTFRWPKVAIS